MEIFLFPVRKSEVSDGDYESLALVSICTFEKNIGARGVSGVGHSEMGPAGFDSSNPDARGSVIEVSE